MDLTDNSGSNNPNQEENAQKDAGIEKLNEVEKVSEQYLSELVSKISELRGKVAEEESMVGELEDFICGLKGRIEVYEQRSAELRIEDLQNVMEGAKQDLQNAKDEYNELMGVIFSECSEMVRDVGSSTVGIEELRLQYSSISTVKEVTSMTKERLDRLVEEYNKLKEEQDAKKESIQKVKDDLRSFEGADIILEQICQEAEIADMEINQCRNYLQAKANRSEYALFP